MLPPQVYAWICPAEISQMGNRSRPGSAQTTISTKSGHFRLAHRIYRLHWVGYLEPDIPTICILEGSLHVIRRAVYGETFKLFVVLNPDFVALLTL